MWFLVILQDCLEVSVLCLEFRETELQFQELCWHVGKNCGGSFILSPVEAFSSKAFCQPHNPAHPFSNLTVTNPHCLPVCLVKGRSVADRNLFHSDDQLAEERRQSSLYDAGSRWNGRRWRNNWLNGCKMEVLLNQELLSGSPHTLCLFVCLCSVRL